MMFVPGLSLDVQPRPPSCVVFVPNRRSSDSMVSYTTVLHSKSSESRLNDSLERDCKGNIIRNAKKNKFLSVV